MKPIILEDWSDAEKMTKEEVEKMTRETLERAFKNKKDACTVCGNTLVYASYYDEGYVDLYVCEIKNFGEVGVNGKK
jgi:hypothetical protein